MKQVFQTLKTEHRSVHSENRERNEVSLMINMAFWLEAATSWTAGKRGLNPSGALNIGNRDQSSRRLRELKCEGQRERAPEIHTEVTLSPSLNMEPHMHKV